MNVLDLPGEILEMVCRQLFIKNLHSRPCIEAASTIGLRYRPDRDEHTFFDRIDRSYYRADVQVLSVCRRLRDIGAHILYGEHRFSCAQPGSFVRYFAEQIGQINLHRIAYLHLEVSRECTGPPRISSQELVNFLVDQMHGLKRLELSKRWCVEINSICETDGASRDDRERANMAWFRDAILRRHCRLVSASWAERATRYYPNIEEDDFVWTRLTLTLTTPSTMLADPCRAMRTQTRHMPLT